MFGAFVVVIVIYLAASLSEGIIRWYWKAHMVGCTRVPVKVPVYVMNTILASMSIVHMVIHICMDFDIYLIDL